jgi:hypothetical protein
MLGGRTASLTDAGTVTVGGGMSPAAVFPSQMARWPQPERVNAHNLYRAHIRRRMANDGVAKLQQFQGLGREQTEVGQGVTILIHRPQKL